MSLKPSQAGHRSSGPRVNGRYTGHNQLCQAGFGLWLVFPQICCSSWQPSQSLPHTGLCPKASLRLPQPVCYVFVRWRTGKTLHYYLLCFAFIPTPESWVVKRKADMGVTFFSFVFKTLPHLWGIYWSRFLNCFFDFFSDGLCCAKDVALTSRSRTFALFPALSRSVVQLIENPLILCAPYQIKTSLQITFQISVASP